MNPEQQVIIALLNLNLNMIDANIYFLLAWVKDKRTKWVLSGISNAFTKMDRTIWNQTPNNTNAGESAHANINRDGRNLSLLAGIVR